MILLEKNHVTANICTVASVGLASVLLLDVKSDSSLLIFGQKAITSVYHAFFQQETVQDMIIWYSMALVLFMLGALLPDIDSENSILGRYVCLPIEHRTWTHTIWAVGLLCIPVYWAPICFWLVLGYFLHLWWDSVSVCGICWFYPFQTYRKYPNGGKIAKNFHFKIYRVGGSSETTLIICLMLLTACLAGGVIYSRFTR